jgi:hypothetical protein
MSKFKLAKSGKKTRKAQGMIPCLILLISGMVLLSLLFWAVLRSGIG